MFKKYYAYYLTHTPTNMIHVCIYYDIFTGQHCFKDAYVRIASTASISIVDIPREWWCLWRWLRLLLRLLLVHGCACGGK
jgi:hypothetical protein